MNDEPQQNDQPTLDGKESLIGKETWVKSTDRDEQGRLKLDYSFDAKFADSSVAAKDINSKSTMIPADQQRTRSAMKTWEEVTNITFVPYSGGILDPDVTLVRADIKNGEVAGFEQSLTNPLDATQMHESEIYIDNPQDIAPGKYGYKTAIHELGHGLGLKHPGKFNAGQEPGEVNVPGPYLPKEKQTRDYTVMAYENGAQAIEGNWPVTPMPYDIAAVQALYGPNTTHNAKSTTYTLEPGKQMTVADEDKQPQIIQGGAMTIWDGGASGQDTLRVPPDYAGEALLDTRPSVMAGKLYYSSVGDTRVFNPIPYQNGAQQHGVIENATGGKGPDRLIGNPGNNLLVGGGGDDLLADDVGSDRMEGGPGTDRYVWSGGTDAISDADNQGNIALNNPLRDNEASEIVGSIALDGDYVRLADGSLRFDASLFGKGSFVTARLSGGQLEIQERSNRLIVEHVPDAGALGINIIAANCSPNSNGQPSCGADSINRAGGDTVKTLSGNDTYQGDIFGDINGVWGSDIVDLGTGSDAASTGKGNDEIRGGPGNDVILPGGGSDKVYGDAGDDSLEERDLADVSGDNDLFYGGPGNDSLVVRPGGGNTLYGDEGDDSLFAYGTGNPSDTKLYGGDGNDTLQILGAGLLDGGAGQNRYRINLNELRKTGGSVRIANLPVPPGQVRPSGDSQTVLLVYQSAPGETVRELTVNQAELAGLARTQYYTPTKQLYVDLSPAVAAGGALAQAAGGITVENFYEGWGGIRGIEGAPLPPWEPAPQAPVTLGHAVYLPLMRAGGARVQVAGANGQAVYGGHPQAAAHPEQLAYTQAPRLDEAAIAAGLAPALIYGGGAVSGLLPRSVTRPVHYAIHAVRIEIDLACIRLARWLRGMRDPSVG